MSRMIASFAPWAASNALLDGVAREFLTLASASALTQIDGRLNSAAASDVTITVSDGTTTATLTIPAGQLHASAPASVTLAPGTVTVQTDGADGGSSGFSGAIWIETVSAPPGGSGTGLVTLDDLKGALGITGATPEQDAWLERQISVYSERIRGYCNRHFNLRRYVERFDRPALVVTREAPIDTIHELTASGEVFDPTTLRIDAALGRVSPPGDQVSAVWSQYQPVEIDYEAGWDTIPHQVTEAIYAGIEPKWQAFLGGAYTPMSPGTIKRETIADAGTVEYVAPAATDSNAMADYMLGFPLATLDQFIRPLHSTGASISMDVWELWAP